MNPWNAVFPGAEQPFACSKQLVRQSYRLTNLWLACITNEVVIEATCGRVKDILRNFNTIGRPSLQVREFEVSPFVTLMYIHCKGLNARRILFGML